MKVFFWYSGGETNPELQKAVAAYEKRLNKYIPFQQTLFSIPKGLSLEQRTQKEKDKVLRHLKPGDFLVLLDEFGQNFSSVELADYLQELFHGPYQRLIFLAGSSHGFHEALKSRSDAKIALSKLTLNHEHVRLIFMEQLYRCMTIINNDPYHH